MTLAHPDCGDALRPGSLTARASRAVMRAEAAIGGVLVAILLALLLANVVSRGVGRPLIWTDELAVHLMVVLAFLGASLCIAAGSHVAVGLLADHLPGRARLWLALLVDLSVMVFLLVMAIVLWRWLDPAGLLRAGSGRALAQSTFNFVYTDPTSTLGIRKFWFWLVMPASCATALIHTLAAIERDLRLLRSAP